jgi:multidrug efflux system outer membrane protein
MTRLIAWAVLAPALLLAGCASVTPDGGASQVSELTRGKTAGVDAAVARGATAEARSKPWPRCWPSRSRPRPRCALHC